MNKTELADAIAEQAGLPRAKANAALDAMIDGVVEALKNGDSVTLIGFGTFSVRERPERTGRNPQTGEAIQIKAARVPSFKAGKGLRDALN